MGIQFLTVQELPKTQTGKIMRSLLRALIRDDHTGFLQKTPALQNPECLRHLQMQLREWRKLHTQFTAGGLPKLVSSTALFATGEGSEDGGGSNWAGPEELIERLPQPPQGTLSSPDRPRSPPSSQSPGGATTASG